MSHLVNGWVNGTIANYGIRPEQDYTSANQHTGFYSSDAASYQPYLTITYGTTIPEPSSWIFMFLSLSFLLGFQKYRK